jgi:hypothetical protein
MYYKFTSDITRLGPILTPYVLEIDDHYVRYSKRNKNLLNKDRKTMAIDSITSVDVNASILGTTLTINGFNDSPIIVRRMNIQDAYLAQKVINDQREKIKK